MSASNRASAARNTSYALETAAAELERSVSRVAELIQADNTAALAGGRAVYTEDAVCVVEHKPEALGRLIRALAERLRLRADEHRARRADV